MEEWNENLNANVEVSQLTAEDDSPSPRLGRLSRISRAMSRDLRKMSWPKRSVLFGDLLMKSYEWGPGNETVTPYLAALMLADAESAKDVLIAGAATGAFTTGQQAVSSLLTTSVMEFAPQTTAALSKEIKRISPEDNPKPYRSLKPATKLVYPVGLGSSFVALRERVLVGKEGFRETLNPALGASALVGAGVFGLTGVLGASRVEAEGTALEPYVEKSFEVASNLFLWVGASAIALSYPYVRSKIKNLKKS